MRVEPARYLLRFDDLCPTMSRLAFERFLRIIEQYRLRPILAVVPDNQDPDLIYDDPAPDFWHLMCTLQAAGATIALHGFRHLCLSSGRSILSNHRQTEFAGVPGEMQSSWIRAGLDILHARGLNPRLFVAPRHGFDRATLHALVQEGLPFLSDGFASRPFLLDGVVCIPQQLWAPKRKPHGLWTICLHTNTATAEFERNLVEFLSEHSSQFTTFDEVIADGPLSPLAWHEKIRESMIVQRRRWNSQSSR